MVPVPHGHEAAGVAWPPSSELQKAMKHYDLTLFVTEWRDLMGNQAHPNWEPYKDIKPLKCEIIPAIAWQKAYAEFCCKCFELLPALRKAPE